MSVSTAAPLVQCVNVVREFSAGSQVVRALAGASIEVRPGELTMLIGPSGCGKTTLISIIAGLLSSTSGHVNLLGRDLASITAGELPRFRLENVGFIFQQYNLIAGLSAVENVSVPLVAMGSSWASATKRAAELLGELGLSAQLQSLPKNLSGGQQQRVSIARALIHKPRLLLCDEPTAALDSHAGHHVMELLRDLAVSPGRAAIIVTHDPRVYAFADRIFSMEDGVVVSEESRDRPGLLLGARSVHDNSLAVSHNGHRT